MLRPGRGTPGCRKYFRMMRRLLLITALLAALPLSARRRLPSRFFLHPGDTIAVISPSSCPDSSYVASGLRILREWGYVPLCGPHIFSNGHGYAGTAEERAADMLWALRSKGVKAILCSRGGDGASQVLCKIPLKEFRRHPKLIIGFSDITAFLSAEVSAGNIALHANMLEDISAEEAEGNDTLNAYLRATLRGDLPAYDVPANQHDNCGTAEGILVGGNMSVFSAIAGSDYDFLEKRGIILFIEDVEERMKSVDRMLHHIMVRGLMKNVRGIIVGQFTHYKRPDMGYGDMYEMISNYLKDYDIPVCYNFPVGHRHLWNRPMLCGARVRLSVSPSGTHLEYLK